MSNFMMSHILHFYHLVALDYVDVNVTGVIPKGFFCPNYDNSYYARGIDPTAGGVAGLNPKYTVNNHNLSVGGSLGGRAAIADLTHYLAGQYVRALKVRRMCHQVGALFAGKMPIASQYTPGCSTTKPYDPNATSGKDYDVRRKVEELMYGGPGWVPGSTVTHPLGAAEAAGAPNPGSTNISEYNPHPESILGFIGKPTDFWTWASTPGATTIGYSPEFLPLWAQAGAALPYTTNPLSLPAPGTAWKAFTGTMLFDVVAAAHIFPEYFWLGTGVRRFLAWGCFEGVCSDGPWVGTPHLDNRLCERGRVHVDAAGAIESFLSASHLDATEYVDQSWYKDTAGKGRHMWKGQTKVKYDTSGSKYTYAKTPRYTNPGGDSHPVGDVPYEVGPLARMMANARGAVFDGGLGNPVVLNAVVNGERMAYYPGILKDVDNVLGPIGIFPAANAAPPGAGAYNTILYGNIPGIAPYKSNYVGDGVLDRIAARALETYYVARHLMNQFRSLTPMTETDPLLIEDDPNQPSRTKFFSWGGTTQKTAPKLKAKGAGLTEAPRGALGHWIVIGQKKTKPTFDKYKGKVANYQIITPTAWNISPIDTGGAGTLGLHGPIEESIMGCRVQSDGEPIEILRVIHSFDPCCACTVHVMNAKGKKVAKAVVEPVA